MSRLASTFAELGKALGEQRNRWRERATQIPPDVVDSGVLSEVFSKLGIETKIDKIEAEFNAEAKAIRAAALEKNAAASADSLKKSNVPESPQPSHFDVYSRSGAPVRQHKFWAVSVVALGVALVIQSVFVFRNSIARAFPGARPALVSLCETFGCAMPLPRDASKIDVVDYGFLQRGGLVGRYAFYATVKNNADFAQDWPNIELVLKNTIGQDLSRRVFVPAEWTPPGKLAGNASMAPRSSVAVNLEIEVTEIVPNKYDVTSFYPSM